jgi:hypothetical protein
MIPKSPRLADGHDVASQFQRVVGVDGPMPVGLALEVRDQMRGGLGQLGRSQPLWVGAGQPIV